MPIRADLDQQKPARSHCYLAPQQKSFCVRSSCKVLLGLGFNDQPGCEPIGDGRNTEVETPTAQCPYGGGVWESHQGLGGCAESWNALTYGSGAWDASGRKQAGPPLRSSSTTAAGRRARAAAYPSAPRSSPPRADARRVGPCPLSRRRLPHFVLHRRTALHALRFEHSASKDTVRSSPGRLQAELLRLLRWGCGHGFPRSVLGNPKEKITRKRRG